MFARLLNAMASQGVAVQDPLPEEESGAAVDTIEIALPCAVVPRFTAALRSIMSVLSDGDGPHDVPVRETGPVSPRGLETLLTTAIARSGGAGRPTVTRSPAGLYSPEYWRIAVTDASRATVDIVTLASRGATQPR